MLRVGICPLPNVLYGIHPDLLRRVGKVPQSRGKRPPPRLHWWHNSPNTLLNWSLHWWNFHQQIFLTSEITSVRLGANSEVLKFYQKPQTMAFLTESRQSDASPVWWSLIFHSVEIDLWIGPRGKRMMLRNLYFLCLITQVIVSTAR